MNRRFESKLTLRQRLLLLLALLLALGALALTVSMGQLEKRPLYDTAVDAARRMQSCMDAIKAEKLARGIEISAEDRFKTGLIGEDYNFITTTLGDPEAKRTTADPDMAALLVFMLEEAGVKTGDCIGCNFSGSFPGMNLAVLCACDAMGVTPVYISSCGSSIWGANNPGFCFPEMAAMLYDEGLISTPPALITPGGGDDVALGLDTDMFSELWTRVCSLGIPTMEERDFETNIRKRMQIYDAAGISCFVAAGGNITSLGNNMVTDFIGQGLITQSITRLNAGSGLLEQYLYRGTPCILLLNIRKLAADWSIPFDPQQQSPIGTGSVYYAVQYPVMIPMAALALEGILLALYFRSSRKNRR